MFKNLKKQSSEDPTAIFKSFPSTQTVNIPKINKSSMPKRSAFLRVNPNLAKTLPIIPKEPVDQTLDENLPVSVDSEFEDVLNSFLSTSSDDEEGEVSTKNFQNTAISSNYYNFQKTASKSKEFSSEINTQKMEQQKPNLKTTDTIPQTINPLRYNNSTKRYRTRTKSPLSQSNSQNTELKPVKIKWKLVVNDDIYSIMLERDHATLAGFVSEVERKLKGYVIGKKLRFEEDGMLVMIVDDEDLKRSFFCGARIVL